MSFLSLPADNPFEAGVVMSVSIADPDRDTSDFVSYVTGTMAEGPWTVNPVFGTIFTTDENSTVVVVSSGGSTRPSSGLVYPRGDA